MAEEFQGGVCGGNWWNSSRNLFASSPCSLASNDIGWLNHELLMDVKTVRSSDDSAGSASDGGSSVVIQDVQKPQQQTTANESISMDSTLQMMGISLSSSTTWNQDLLHDSGRSEENYSNFLLDSSMNYRPLNKDWSSNNCVEDSSINSFKQVNQSFPLEQQPLDSISTSTECAATNCPGLSAGFPLNSASYGYTSSLLQTLFDNCNDPQPQQSLFDNQAMNYSSSAASYQLNSNGFLPSLPLLNPSSAKRLPTNRLPLTNNAPLWNATAAASSNVRSTFLPSTQSQFLPSSLNNKKPKLPSFSAKHQHEGGKDLASVAKKVSNEPATFKRPRIETPSPLPTFKVRKEKLGDRITALQQLVSPFGKTDTASVLHEAIEYIKFLHDQVNALSTPYLKYGSPPLQRQQAADKPKDQERLIRDLKSRGLCLVPISSTFPVAAETTTDFWTPTFGVNLK